MIIRVLSYLAIGGILIMGGLAAVGRFRMSKDIPKAHSLNRNLGLQQLVLGAALLLVTLNNIDTVQSVITKSAAMLLVLICFWANSKTVQDIREYAKRQSKDKANSLFNSTDS